MSSPSATALICPLSFLLLLLTPDSPDPAHHSKEQITGYYKLVEYLQSLVHTWRDLSILSKNNLLSPSLKRYCIVLYEFCLFRVGPLHVLSLDDNQEKGSVSCSYHQIYSLADTDLQVFVVAHVFILVEEEYRGHIAE